MPKIEIRKCAVCGRMLSTWDMKCANATGVQNTCANCIAKDYELSPEDFNEVMKDFFHLRPCQDKSRRCD